MTEQAQFQLPNSITDCLQTADDDPDTAISTLMTFLGEALHCDRCFLYLRNPSSSIGKVTHCWRRNSQFPNLLDPDWKPEPESLPDEDPLFAAALNAEPSIFVEDVETADPSVVNREFEQANFGHRALVHAHLVKNGQLWGVLQPCVFGQPRVWTDRDRAVINQVEQAITPLAISLVKTANV